MNDFLRILPFLLVLAFISFSLGFKFGGDSEIEKQKVRSTKEYKDKKIIELENEILELKK